MIKHDDDLNTSGNNGGTEQGPKRASSKEYAKYILPIIAVVVIVASIATCVGKRNHTEMVQGVEATTQVAN